MSRRSTRLTSTEPNEPQQGRVRKAAAGSLKRKAATSAKQAQSAKKSKLTDSQTKKPAQRKAAAKQINATPTRRSSRSNVVEIDDEENIVQESDVEENTDDIVDESSDDFDTKHVVHKKEIKDEIVESSEEEDEKQALIKKEEEKVKMEMRAEEPNKPARRRAPPRNVKKEEPQPPASETKRRARQVVEDDEEDGDLVDVKDVKKVKYRAPVKREKKMELTSDGDMVSLSEESDEKPVKPIRKARGTTPKRKSRGGAIVCHRVAAPYEESDDEPVKSPPQAQKSLKIKPTGGVIMTQASTAKSKRTGGSIKVTRVIPSNEESDDESVESPPRAQGSTSKTPARRGGTIVLKSASTKKAPAAGKGKAKAATPRRGRKNSSSSSDFIASDESSQDDLEEDDWAAKLKAKVAKGKDVDDASSDDDDDAPIKQKKRVSTPIKPKKSAEEDQDDEPDEPREYPYYKCIYRKGGRARCKTCEKALSKGDLCIAIELVHSRFGLNTYYKHVECTLLNNEIPIELDGLRDLDPEDLAYVQKYMLENSKRGVEDERAPLSDEHFIKRDILPAAKPSPHLTASLLPYQQEGLAWMKAQEASKYRGGILADEMGMGKTIQAISLLLENVKIKRSKGMLMGGGTLIICPVIACMQWKSEIERFVESNHLSILLYHGPKRTNLATHIASYDVVLTTYSILESEGRKLMEAEKVACAYCKKLFVPEKLIPHNKYFCGPDAHKTKKQAKQQKGKGKLLEKKKKLSDDESEDQSSSEDDEPIKRSIPPPKVNKKPAKKGRSPLHEIEWTRIILDEAHYIKDKKCSTARSVFRLQSDYKWCLSGTPLQNRIGELFSLVRFLQVDPFAFYECAECDCKQLDFSILQGRCKHCEHTAMQHYSSFNKNIVNPIQGYGYVAEGKLAMLKLQNDLLRHILLRRTKESRADDISLPPKLVRVRRDALDEREKDFYESIYTQSKAQFNTYVSSGTLLNNYAHIFDLLIRLRQAVDHPYLVIYSNSNPALQVPTPEVPAKEDLPLVAPPSAEEEEKSGPVCGFCHEPLEQPVCSTCNHEFCKSCVEEYVGSLPMGAPALCPTCEEPLTVDITADNEEESPVVDTQPVEKEVQTGHLSKTSLLRKLPQLANFQSSTKIEALMEELHLMRQHDPSAKAIVFSQFVNMLDLIEHRLLLANIRCVKLSGHMAMAHRDRLLTLFRNDPQLTVFLISLKAGGVALNLTVASHIFLMDPWWNPAAEHQAIDRTHRLGQFKPIRATRFVIANTIEERILKLQEKKQLVFEGTVGSSTAALARLTIEDLRFLFSG
ncbi:unnamed protein product [Aphanomyces euteiches]